MGFSFNPIDAVKNVAGAIGDAAKGGANAFGQAIDAAKTAASKMSVSDVGHMALDGLGMVPVIGEAADLVNAGWYAAEGDMANAALSGTAAIPFVGNAATGAKWVKRGVDAADAVTDVAKGADRGADVAKAADAGGDAAKAADAGKAAPPSAADGPNGPTGPKDPPKGGAGDPGPDLDGLAFRADLPTHLAGPHGFKPNGQLHGTHNLDNARAELATRNGRVTSLTDTSAPGVKEMKYEVEKPNGNVVTGRKTVYDQKVHSDQKMLDMAQGAGEQGWAKHKAGETGPFDVAQDGVNFRVYINRDATTGAPYIGNVHPIQ